MCRLASGPLQTQIHRDFAPVWGVDADLVWVPSGSTPVAGLWWLKFFDDSDQANDLGYHDVMPEGLPIGKIFAHSDVEPGTSWTVTAGHELLEMLGDPEINLTALVEPDANTARFMPVRPAMPARTTSMPLLLMGRISRILSIRPGFSLR